MPDNKENRGPEGRNRINVHEDYEVTYWTKKFGVNSDVLYAAVKAVGVSSTAVNNIFSRRNKLPSWVALRSSLTTSQV
jgi:hypothetical protein